MPTTHWTAGIKLNHHMDSYWGYIKTGFVFLLHAELTFVNQKSGLDKCIHIEICSSSRTMFTHIHTHTRTHIYTHSNMLHHSSFICNMSVTVHSWGIYLGQGPLSHAQPHKCHVHANTRVSALYTHGHTQSPSVDCSPADQNLHRFRDDSVERLAPPAHTDKHTSVHTHTHTHIHTHTHTYTQAQSASLTR